MTPSWRANSHTYVEETVSLHPHNLLRGRRLTKTDIKLTSNLIYQHIIQKAEKPLSSLVSFGIPLNNLKEAS